MLSDLVGNMTWNQLALAEANSLDGANVQECNLLLAWAADFDFDFVRPNQQVLLGASVPVGKPSRATHWHSVTVSDSQWHRQYTIMQDDLETADWASGFSAGQ